METEKRYIVFCWEIGYTPDKPYHETNDIEEAISVCISVGRRYYSKSYVRDTTIDFDGLFRDRFIIEGHKIPQDE
jgi:hypothetical protein